MKKFTFFLLGFLFAQLSFGQTIIARQDFEASPASPTMTFTTANIGTGSGGFSSSVLTGINRPINSNLFASGAQGYRVVPASGTAVAGQTLTFSAVNTTGYTGIQVSYRVAAFSIGTLGGGMDLAANLDQVLLEVSPDGGTTWFQQSRVNSINFNNSAWDFTGATGIGTRAYLANNSFTTHSTSNPTQPSTVTGSAAITTVIVTNLPAVNNLQVRITPRSNSISEAWYIDDVIITGTVVTSDTSPPSVSTFSPLDDATGASITGDLTINFNENVAKGTGNIIIRRTSDDSIFETIDVTSGLLTVSGATVTINPAGTFDNTTGYYVEIPATAFKDAVDNFYTGISGATNWNFTTIGISSITLADNGTQVAAAVVAQGASAHVLHKFSLAVSSVNTALTGVQVTTAGTYATADLTNLRVRYSTDATLNASDATLSTYTSVPTAGTLTFPSFVAQAINAGSTGYIFITADVTESATLGNTISVGAVTMAQLTFSGGIKSGSTTAGGSQTVAAKIITFDFAALAGNEATANSNFNNANLTSSSISRGAGLTATANGARFNSQNWGLTDIETAITNNDYVEFTITPNAGYQFSVSSIVFNIMRSATSFTGIALRSSVDNYASNLDAEKAIVDIADVTEIIRFSFSQANSSTPVTYRLYGWAEAIGGSGGFEGTGNDIIVTGTTEATSTPTLYTSVAIATGYSYNAGSGPSTSQTFNLNGINLTGFTSDITLSAVGTNYEVSTNNISFGESRTVSYTAATLTSTPVYIRLKAGLLAGSYNSENISISGGGATTINVTCSGTVSPTIISFDFLGLLGNEATANSNFNNLNLTASTISRGSGVTATTNANRFNAQEWSITTIADAVTNNEYIEFTITPNSGYQFSVSSMVCNMQRSPTGLRGIALRSSADNYTSNLDSEKAIPDNDSTTEIITFTFAQANSIIPVTYRLYGYAETTAGTGGMEGTGNDIVVNGTVTQVTLATDYFRSKVTGDWEIATSWESSPDNIIWIAATLVPTNTANTITILNSQNINVNSAVTAGSVIVNSGGTLTLRGNNTLELKSGGTFTINNGGTIKIQNSNGFSGSPTTAISSYNSPSITLNAGSTVEYAGTNQTITPSGYSNLTISGIGLKILAGTSEVLVSNELKVTAGTLQIDDNKLLTVTNAINNTSGNPILVKNNGNLVQITEVDNATANANTGHIKMTRTSRLMADNDYIYWGSPVKENILLPTSQIPTNFDSTYQWDLNGGVDGAWNALSSIVPGRGFITKVASGVTTATNFDFTGTPNNGTVNVIANGYDTNFNLDTTGNTILLANPYPSALDATKFVEANASILDGTLYFWTSSTANAGGAYSNNDYATWNKMGGTATAPPPSKPLDTSLKPAGTIAAGQGFFADIHADGNISFTNAIRERTTSSNSQFFKTTKSNKTKSERHRIWLNLTNEKNAFRQMLVGYINDATNGFDRSFDGEAFTDNEINIYSILENKTLVIQGRAVPFNDADIVPLGVFITNGGNYTISIDEVDGLFTNQEIYLEDKFLGVAQRLNSPYTFNTTAGTFNDRFVLRYTNKTLTANDAEILDNQVLVSIKNKLIKVNSKVASIDKVSVYDLLGKQFFNKDKVNNNELTISNLTSTQQTLLVKISLQNGNVVTKKIMF